MRGAPRPQEALAVVLQEATAGVALGFFKVQEQIVQGTV
jgi:hypothetical protein